MLYKCFVFTGVGHWLNRETYFQTYEINPYLPEKHIEDLFFET